MSSSMIGGGGGGGGGGNHFGSPHSDVLSVVIDTTGTTSEQRETLYNELHRRSKAAVKAQQYQDAIALYTKAIECCTTSSNSSSNSNSNTGTPPGESQQQYQHLLPLTKAALYANISLCYGKMSRWTDAVSNAQQSVDVESTYMKGWYRLGQAFMNSKQYSDAIPAIERAIILDPNNSVLSKELQKCKVALESQRHDDELNAEKGDVPTSTTTTTTITTGTSSATKMVDDAGVEIKVMDPNVDDKGNKKNGDLIMDDSTNNSSTVVFTKSDHVRGYKIVNGKKTSYFHNELSDDVKQLIGDIAPKKIIPSDGISTTSKIPSSSSEQQQQPDGKSVWNTAGTWEEKDCTSWANQTMTELLTTKVAYTLPLSSPAPNAIVSISKIVISPSSHASVATVRGKKRYIYELDITIHWNFNHENKNTDTDNNNSISSSCASGTIRFPDIDGTCMMGDGYEATEFIIGHMDDSTVQPVLTQFVYSQGLRIQIHDAIDEWVRLFKDTY